MESPVVIDLWTVDPERRGELVERISETLRRLLAGREGFVSAHVFESIDGGTVLVVVQMRTARDRQLLTDSPEAQRMMRELRAIASKHMNLYRLVDSITEADAAR
jgi:hypothetical protein